MYMLSIASLLCIDTRRWCSNEVWSEFLSCSHGGTNGNFRDVHLYVL
jgi:hypothetical protein